MSDTTPETPTVQPPTIPAIYTEFAKGVALLAKSAGIDHFTITMRPDFDHRADSRAFGELLVSWRKVDGRGRPSEGLSISMKCEVQIPIVNEPQSFN